MHQSSICTEVIAPLDPLPARDTRLVVTLRLAMLWAEDTVSRFSFIVAEKLVFRVGENLSGVVYVVTRTRCCIFFRRQIGRQTYDERLCVKRLLLLKEEEGEGKEKEAENVERMGRPNRRTEF